MKKALHIAITTQKGGAGKSTLTVHLASTLHYIYGYQVAIMDCDFPQHTITAYRNSDIVSATHNSKLGQQIQQQAIVPYSVLSAQVDNAREIVKREIEARPVDIVLYDLPGTINREGLPELLLSLDYLFVPIETDKGTIASAMSFLSLIAKLRDDYENNLKGVFAFWNKYNRSEKLDMYNKVEELFASKGFDMLQTRIAQLVIYKNERSTLLPLPSKDYERLTLSDFLSEILIMLGNHGLPILSMKEIKTLESSDTSSDAIADVTIA